MSENKENFGFLGKDFQNKIIWQLLTDNIFGEDVVDKFEASYIDDNYLKRIIILYKNYYSENNRVPSILNNSIVEAVNEHIKDSIEKETILTILTKIKNYNARVRKNKIPNDSDVIQKQIWRFIKQQKYLKLAKKIITKTSEGDINLIDEIENDTLEINKIGVTFDKGHNIEDDIDETLEADYRNPISTGISGLDNVMGGGLGKGEMGFILAALGTGKTTMLTVIANTAFQEGKNVIQIFFEDTYAQVKRKHYTRYTGIGLNDYEENKEQIKKNVLNKIETIKGKFNNRITLLKLPQDENVTIPFIKKYILDLEKIYGIKYDMVVLDYIDCVESHIPNRNDALQNELTVIKGFEAMLADFDIAGWSAFQGNRSSIGADTVNTNQMGGNIKKAQKTHFLVSIARTDEQKVQKMANIKILKSRFGGDGYLFQDCLFDNEYLKIELNTSNVSTIEMLLSTPESLKNFNPETEQDNDVEQKFNNILSNLNE